MRTTAQSAGSAGGRAVFRGTADVLIALPLFAFAPLVRHWHLRWGACDAEVHGAMPGDDLIADPSFAATRAISIDAPPGVVWALIVQLGYGRAGWYSYDLLDNGGRPSADYILPEYQHPMIGDWVPMAAKVNETTAFTISGFEEHRWLLWVKRRSTWAWMLKPTPEGGTRLVTRLRDSYDWRRAPANAMLSLVLFEFGDFAMMRRLLLGVRRRAEDLAGVSPVR